MPPLQVQQTNVAKILGCEITSEPENDPFGNITAAELKKICGSLLPLNSDIYRKMLGIIYPLLSLDSTSMRWGSPNIQSEDEREGQAVNSSNNNLARTAIYRYLLALSWVDRSDNELFIMSCHGLIIGEFKERHFRRLDFYSTHLRKDVWCSQSYGVEEQSEPYVDWYFKFDTIPRAEISLW
jgi:hypothetical protein